MSGRKLLFVSACLYAFFTMRSPVFADQITYGYDDFGRLTDFSYDDGYALTKTIYEYDNVGNFKNESITKLMYPQISLSPLPINFGTVYSGSEANQTITVSNTGGDGLTVSNLEVSGTDKAIFKITSDGCTGTTLLAGAVCDILVTVAPVSTTTTGTKTASLTITSNANINPLSPIALNASVSQPTLTVTKLGGAGAVISSPAGISCGDVCGTTFTGPTSVTLTAIPDAGNLFVGWSGDCLGTATNCSLNVDKAANVSATFIKTDLNYAVNLSVTGSGMGSVTITPSGVACNDGCSALFPANTKVTLHPTTSEYSVFTGWSGGTCGGTADCIFILNTDKTLTAAFDINVAHQAAIGDPPTYYFNILDAYMAATDGDVIMIWAQPYNEDLVLDRPNAITIRGGYNENYTSITGSATLKGTLTIRDGKVIADGLNISK